MQAILLAKIAIGFSWADELGVALHVAYESGLEGVVKRLLEEKEIDPNWKGSDGNSPLHKACQNGNRIIVSLLLANEKVDPNLSDRTGKTPLFIASEYNRINVVHLLSIDRRVNVNQATNDGRTPFFVAYRSENYKTAQILRNHEAFDITRKSCANELLIMACTRGDKEVFELLLQAGQVDVNFSSYGGETPLFAASKNGHHEFVSVLLAIPDLDPNKKSRIYDDDDDDYHLKTPLWIASREGHLSVVQRMLASGRQLDTDLYDQTWLDPPCVSLINDYETDPVSTRDRLQRELGFIAYTFALVVFLCDGLLRITETTVQSPASRFFKICSRLPLEMQRVLCNRAYGSPEDDILSEDSELAFRLLARSGTWRAVSSNEEGKGEGGSEDSSQEESPTKKAKVSHENEEVATPNITAENEDDVAPMDVSSDSPLNPSPVDEADDVTPPSPTLGQQSLWQKATGFVRSFFS